MVVSPVASHWRALGCGLEGQRPEVTPVAGRQVVCLVRRPGLRLARTQTREQQCAARAEVWGRRRAVDTRVKTRQTVPDGMGAGGLPRHSVSEPEGEQEPHFPPLLVTQSWG